jgi:hypothetical protein
MTINAKTLDYLFDNQAFAGYAPPQYFVLFLAISLNVSSSFAIKGFYSK